MPSLYNPANRVDNCGYCAISFALFEKDKQIQDAEALYRKMREALRLRAEDELPRTLLYSDPMVNPIGLPVQYQILNEGARSPSDYFIQNVSEKLGLPVSVDTPDVPRLNGLLQEGLKLKPADRFKSLAKKVLDARGENDRRPMPDLRVVENSLKQRLAGRAIIGIPRGKINHFLNLTVYATGDITAFDPQIDRKYSELEIRSELLPVNLFMRWLET